MGGSRVEQCYIPKRFILAALGFIGVSSICAMRISLSVTIVAMINSTIEGFSNTTNIDEGCPKAMLQTKVTKPEKLIGPQYNWNAEEHGLILGAFYYGYAVSQVPAGYLAERIGAKWLFGVGVLNTAICTLFTPLAAKLDATAIIILRIIQGLGEGMAFPTMNLLIAQWSPKMERSRMLTFVLSGMPIGSVLSMSIAGWLSGIEMFGGWPSVFYFFGTIGCLWFVFWAVLVYETPANHPTISLEEVHCIQENNDGQHSKRPETPWKAIFCSLPMWAVVVAQVGDGFGYLLFIAELPSYFSTVFHFDINENGVLSAIPFVVQTIFAWIASYFADRLRKKNALSVTNIRKIFTAIGLIGPALCVLSITASGCRPYLVIFLLNFGMVLNGFAFSGINAVPLDMCPNFAGTVFAICNASASLTGFIAPAIVGAFRSTGTTVASWNNVFYITAGIYVFGAIFFAAFGSAELQPWGVAKEDMNTVK